MSFRGIAAAARRQGNRSLESYAITRANSPQWDKQTALNLENRAAIERAGKQADYTVKTAENRAELQQMQTDAKLDVLKARDSAKDSTKMGKGINMAGKVAAAALMKEPEPIKPVKDTSGDAFRKYLEQATKDLERDKEKPFTPSTPATPVPTYDPNKKYGPDGKIIGDVEIETPTGKNGTRMAGAVADAGGSNVGGTGSSNTNSGTMSPEFKKIYDLAVADGRAKFPEMVAAQAMHETGHLKNPNSVYFASGKTNPFGQTGNRGHGTMTREGDPNGWTKYPDLQTAVSDHITLWHDVGNNSGNYNAFNNKRDGLASVIKAYSPNADPANISKGFTEDAYSKSVRKILEDNGFKF